jgi:hypothetical protein
MIACCNRLLGELRCNPKQEKPTTTLSVQTQKQLNDGQLATPAGLLTFLPTLPDVADASLLAGPWLQGGGLALALPLVPPIGQHAATAL